MLAFSLRLAPSAGQPSDDPAIAASGAEGLDIAHHVDHRRPPGGEGGSERAGEVAGFSTRKPRAPHGLGIVAKLTSL